MAHIKFSPASASDIPAALREEWNIQVLPFPIAMGDREDMDGFDFTPDEFFQMLLDSPQIPTHAQLNPYLFTECFEKAWKEGYTDLIHTSINSKGSATYGNAIQARDEFYEDHPDAQDTFHIHIIDSKNYTMGCGWAVVQGARMAREEKPVQEILAHIQDWIDHARVLFAPLDLRFAKKSGRVSAAAAFMGEALGLKPVMTFEGGDSKVLTKVRGEKNVIPTLLEMCQKTREPNTPYLVIRAGNPEQAERMIDAKAIGAMKRGVRFINLARGEIVDDDAMLAALDTGWVAAYVTDFPNNRLVGAPHVLAMPHLGASTPESEQNCAVMAVDQLRDYLENGNIRNSVNLPAVSQERSGVCRLCLIHKNVPAMLASITTLLSRDGINVENLSNKSRGDYAYTIVDLSAPADQCVIDEVTALENVIRVRVIQ